MLIVRTPIQKDYLVGYFRFGRSRATVKHGAVKRISEFT